jgi:hypothetical protein
MSKDPVWLRCIENNEDLHSVCAEMVYHRKWQDAAETGCAYYEDNHQKCKCKKHKIMRSNVKPIDFGLAYGMSEFKLAGDLGISIREAKNLIDQYFSAFPNIEALLEWLGRFGVENGYIMTLAPFNRKRYFPFWEYHREYVHEHINGIRYNPTLGEIERASKNMPKTYGHVKSGEFRESYGSEAMLILSQAAEDLGSAEGATTTGMSSNNNSSQERPNLSNNVVSCRYGRTDINTLQYLQKR